MLFPAWAGVIPAQQSPAQTSLTFPRMGGGDPICRTLHIAINLFSPHGRG